MSESKYGRIKRVRRGKGSGKLFTPQELKTYLDGELFELAKQIKEFIIAEAEKGGRHKFRKDGRGGFVNSTEVEFTTDGVEITLPEQAYYIEQGRKPLAKKVPIQAIIKWLKRYRILGRDKRSGKYRKTSAASINSTAWAIQQSIYKNGIKARPFIQASLDFTEQLISQVIDEIMIPEIIQIVEFSFSDKK
ncbi:hypothetical protein [uncultured Pontibacter sp.]|uniref:hypothetical protein n=1 Tax=uncultured Pontibacter sp. TaxID=453356 RepID=UPI002613B7D6|nr:hypothetical protein [uncultured Pontibacter sp.]